MDNDKQSFWDHLDVLGSVNKLCHALFPIRKLIGRGTASAKGRDHPSEDVNYQINK